jgi:aerobic carbon-monoxide dehydrogenase medium subunit
MYPRAFEYFAVGTVREASELLAHYGDEARVLAGGQSLIPLMKLRLANPSHIIDIGNILGLDYVEEVDGALHVGALATHAAVLEFADVRERWPLMADAVSVIGDHQVRNWGTVGGALAEADPAGDWGAVILALKARIRCVSSRGERWLAAADFFTDAYTTQLATDELITEIVFRAPKRSSAGAYLKLERRAGDFAVVSLGVQLSLKEAGLCEEASIALAAAGLTPIYAEEAALFLAGKELRSDVIDEAARRVAAATQPLSDIRGSEEYKRAAAQALFKQAVEVAVWRSRGETVEAGHGR